MECRRQIWACLHDAAEGDNAGRGSKQARVVYVVDDDETEEYD